MAGPPSGIDRIVVSALQAGFRKVAARVLVDQVPQAGPGEDFVESVLIEIADDESGLRVAASARVDAAVGQNHGAREEAVAGPLLDGVGARRQAGVAQLGV